MEKTKELSSHQFICFVVISTISMKMFILPALMLKEGGRDFYWSMIIFLAIETLSLIIYFCIGKILPDKSLYDILDGTLGKVISRALLVLITSYFLMKMVLVLTEIKQFFSDGVYSEVFWTVFLIPLLVLMCYFSIKKLRGLGRLVVIVLPMIIISAIFLMVLCLLDTDMSEVFPLFEEGASKAFLPLGKFPMWFGDFPLLMITLGKVKHSKYTVPVSIIVNIAMSVVVLMFSLVFSATYGNLPELMDYGHNLSSITQYALRGQKLGRFDITIFAIWISGLIINASLLFYSTSANVNHVLCVKKNNIFTPLALGVIIYVLSIFVFENSYVLTHICIEILPIVAYAFNVGLPILFFILSIVMRIKSKKKKQPEENDEEYSVTVKNGVIRESGEDVLLNSQAGGRTCEKE